MSHNDITGDKIKSKVNSDKYRDNWDKVFGKPDKELQEWVEHNIDKDCPVVGPLSGDLNKWRD